MQEKPFQLRDLRLIRLRRAHKILVFHHAQQVAPHIDRDGSRADGLLHRVRHWDRGERIGREVHCIQTVRRFVDRQAAAQRVKAHLCLAGLNQFHHGIGCRHGRVTAEVNLTVQREPAQMPALAGFSQIGRLGEVVLPRDALEHFIAVGAVEHTDRRGIA